MAASTLPLANTMLVPWMPLWRNCWRQVCACCLALSSTPLLDKSTVVDTTRPSARRSWCPRDASRNMGRRRPSHKKLDNAWGARRGFWPL